jgi:hypothetical protein
MTRRSAISPRSAFRSLVRESRSKRKRGPPLSGEFLDRHRTRPPRAPTVPARMNQHATASHGHRRPRAAGPLQIPEDHPINRFDARRPFPGDRHRPRTVPTSLQFRRACLACRSIDAHQTNRTGAFCGQRRRPLRARSVFDEQVHEQEQASKPERDENGRTVIYIRVRAGWVHQTDDATDAGEDGQQQPQ